jgi:arylsulfatase
MAIDLLPTIAHITNARLPALPIDGKNVWPVLTGSTSESPQPAYFFYYHVNELHAVRSGKWKMYFPHRYRTLNGRPGGTGGIPVPYDYIQLEDTLVYDLDNDPGEKDNLFGKQPAVENRLFELADSIRKELGDRLTGIEGSGTR